MGYDDKNKKVDLSNTVGKLSSQYNEVLYPASRAYDGIRHIVASSPSSLKHSKYKYESNFDDGKMNGWNCKQITTCGNYGKICGGYNETGKGYSMTKTFRNLRRWRSYTLTLDFIAIDSWNGERASVYVNGRKCRWIVNDKYIYWPRFRWSGSSLGQTNRAQVCGSSKWPDQKVRLSCTTRIYRSYAKVVVKTTLNQKTTDESFAIDNVVFDIAKANMFHTRRDRVANKKGSWAEFTLPFPVRVSKVIVYNRQDCCQYNLYGALLELVDNKNNIQGAKMLYSSNKQIISFEAHSRGLSIATTAKAAFDFVSTSDKYANIKYMACKRIPGGHGLREHMLSRCYIPALGNSIVDGTAPNYFCNKQNGNQNSRFVSSFYWDLYTIREAEALCVNDQSPVIVGIPTSLMEIKVEET